MIFTDELVIYSCFLYTTVHFMSQAYHGQAGLFSEGHCRVNLAVVALGGCFRTTGGLGIALMRWIYIKHPSRSGFFLCVSAYTQKKFVASLIFLCVSAYTQKSSMQACIR